MSASRSNTLVVVAGLPGAGKSTMLARIAAGGTQRRLRVLDPDPIRQRISHRFPGLPYGFYRGAVHVLHGAHLLWRVALGPREPGDLLFVHATTRRSRRVTLARLAKVCGWLPVLVVLDVPVDQARGGQDRRGRVLDATGFARHVWRWERDRETLVAVDGTSCGPWDAVHVVTRTTTPQQIRTLVAEPPAATILPRSPLVRR